ncbi:MAG: CDP-alcohol phosphatidyltransferase family protein [Ruminococcaceae bacterium]|nr:CDP-alcohol phosphatidyltransferase family protein [Oscillospiraceae bacterium]
MMHAEERHGGKSMIIKDWKKDIITIPNLLSLFRLVLIPVYVVIYLNAQDVTDYYIAGSILAVSCLTDAIDGKIARHFNMISNLGKILDPLADKATQFTLILCLAIRNPVLWILVALFVVKESFQLIAGLMILRRGKILSGALLAGKISTAVLFVSLIVMVLFPQLDTKTIQIITLVDSGVLLASFIGYARLYYTHSPMIQELEDNSENEKSSG